MPGKVCEPLSFPRGSRPSTSSLPSQEERRQQLTSPQPQTGQSQFLSAPIPAKLNFDIGLSPRPTSDLDDASRLAESDARIATMLANQAALNSSTALAADEDTIVEDPKLSDNQRREMLQKALNMAASNGDTERVRRIIFGKAKEYVDIDRPDEEGTSPLIYASCFVSGVPH